MFERLSPKIWAILKSSNDRKSGWHEKGQCLKDYHRRLGQVWRVRMIANQEDMKKDNVWKIITGDLGKSEEFEWLQIRWTWKRTMFERLSPKIWRCPWCSRYRRRKGYWWYIYIYIYIYPSRIPIALCGPGSRRHWRPHEYKQNGVHVF